MEQTLANKAFVVDTNIKQLKKHVNATFLEFGRLLKQVKDEKLWQQLDYETFEAYIAQPELSFDRSNVYKFIQIYEVFVLGCNVAPERLSDMEWTKLALLLPHTTKDNYEDILIDAKELSRSDLREKFALPKGECEHEPITICRKCRKTL